MNSTKITFLIGLALSIAPTGASAWSLFGSSQDDEVLKFVKERMVLEQFKPWQKPSLKQIKIIERYDMEGTVNKQLVMGPQGLSAAGEKAPVSYYLTYAEVDYGRSDGKRDATAVCIAVYLQKAKKQDGIMPLVTQQCTAGNPTAADIESAKKNAEWPTAKKDGICDGEPLKGEKCCYQEKYRMGYSNSLGVDKNPKTGDCIPNDKKKKLALMSVCTKYSSQVEASGMDAHEEETFTCDSSENWLFATSADTCIFEDPSNKKAPSVERIKVVKLSSSVVKMNTGECQCRGLGQPRYNKEKNQVSCPQTE